MTKPSSVAYQYTYGQQQQATPGAAAGHVNYPAMSQQGAPAPFQPQPPPNSGTFAVGTPAYYVDPAQQQLSYSDSPSCMGPQLFLFVFGWLLAPFWFVGAMLPACSPLGNGERGLWIANIVMSIVSFTLAIIIATTLPILKYGMHGDGGTT